MKVLIIGGGIGGLSTTLALRRQGVDVDVVERDPEWGVYGVGIIQPGNALRALDSLGLKAAGANTYFVTQGRGYVVDKGGNPVVLDIKP